ncbi:hypothetical protein [Gallibacterium anatis]|uniref:hypothetical protein n=1 Tax=Gallibacterium anatis TaxID=750 RepID=UPI0039FCA54F
MSREKKYYLSRNDVFYESQKKLKERLRSIRNKYKDTEMTINDPTDINDLKDYIECYYPDSQRILNRFDLENSNFIVKESPDYNTKCFYISDENGKQHFSIEKFSKPTPLANFKQSLAFSIMDIKREIKKKEIIENGQFGNDCELHHKKPNFNQIINNFMKKYNILESDLLEIVSDNNSGNNVPKIKIEEIKKNFLEYYQENYKHYQYELKPRIKKLN